MLESPQVPSPPMALTDREVLLVLYRSTDGRNWVNKTNWGTNASLSRWYGVEVNGKGLVIKLTLDKNNLQGILRTTLRFARETSLTFPKKRLIESGPFMALHFFRKPHRFLASMFSRYAVHA